jgi:tartrate-resistant acid phosphatase type 5
VLAAPQPQPAGCAPPSLYSLASPQAYFSGHDHDLEHLHVREVGAHYVVTGGGSDCHREFQGAASSVWQYPGSGFVAAAVAGDTLTVDFYTLDGDLQAAHTLAIRR